MASNHDDDHQLLSFFEHQISASSHHLMTVSELLCVLRLVLTCKCSLFPCNPASCSLHWKREKCSNCSGFKGYATPENDIADLLRLALSSQHPKDCRASAPSPISAWDRPALTMDSSDAPLPHHAARTLMQHHDDPRDHISCEIFQICGKVYRSSSFLR